MIIDLLGDLAPWLAIVGLLLFAVDFVAAELRRRWRDSAQMAVWSDERAEWWEQRKLKGDAFGWFDAECASEHRSKCEAYAELARQRRDAWEASIPKRWRDEYMQRARDVARGAQP
jgi:hypothetical protein